MPTQKLIIDGLTILVVVVWGIYGLLAWDSYLEEEKRTLPGTAFSRSIAKLDLGSYEFKQQNRMIQSVYHYTIKPRVVVEQPECLATPNFEAMVLDLMWQKIPAENKAPGPEKMREALAGSEITSSEECYSVAEDVLSDHYEYSLIDKYNHFQLLTYIVSLAIPLLLIAVLSWFWGFGFRIWHS